jgi:hypothetical protein
MSTPKKRLSDLFGTFLELLIDESFKGGVERDDMVSSAPDEPISYEERAHARAVWVVVAWRSDFTGHVVDYER